jgi:hypothetical protein
MVHQTQNNRKTRTCFKTYSKTNKKYHELFNNNIINNNLSTQPSRGVEMNDVIFPIDKQPDSISITNEIINSEEDLDSLPNDIQIPYETKFQKWFNKLPNCYSAESYNTNNRLITKLERPQSSNLSSSILSFIKSYDDNKIQKSKKMENDLLRLMKDNFSICCSIPQNLNEIRKQQDKIEEQTKSNRTIYIDICAMGCMVFDSQYTNHDKCIDCKRNRYLLCRRYRCRTKKQCVCASLYLVPDQKSEKNIFYRPIIGTIKQLLRYETFPHLLKYYAVKHKSFLSSDIKHGKMYTKHKKEMTMIYEDWINKNMFNKLDYEHISLCLGFFYDGAMIGKTATLSFIPAIFNILNLPPAFRNQFGIGQFVLSVYQQKQNTDVEKYLFKELIVEELLKLAKGIVIIDEHTNKKYFVTARVIQYQLDTKEAEHVMNFEAVGSYAHCILCRNVRGKRENVFNKTIYVGHRVLLPKYNYLRYFGQSRICCPTNFHNYIPDANAKKFSFTSLANDERIFRQKNLYCYPTTVSKNLFNTSGGPCEGSDYYKQEISDFVNNRNQNLFQFCNSKYIKDYQIFDNYLYFGSCDFRPQVNNRRETSMEYERKVNNSLVLNNPVDGIKGNTFFSLLPYFDFEKQFEWDWFHCLGNFI